MYAIRISIQTKMHYWFCIFCMSSSPFTNFYSVILHSWGKNKTAIITWYLLLSYCIHSTDIFYYSNFHPVLVSHHYWLRTVLCCVIYLYRKNHSSSNLLHSQLPAEPHSPPSCRRCSFLWLYLWHIHEYFLGKKKIFQTNKSNQ